MPARLPSVVAARPNLMTFPRALRDAIPAQAAIGGRVLQLGSIDALPAHTYRGPRVHLRLLAEESGKLSGRFPILLDLDSAAARQLAAALNEIAARAEALEPGEGW